MQIFGHDLGHDLGKVEQNLEQDFRHDVGKTRFLIVELTMSEMLSEFLPTFAQFLSQILPTFARLLSQYLFVPQNQRIYSTARKKGPGGPFLIKQILRFSDVFRRFPVALAEGPDCDVNPAVVRKWFERLQRSSNVMNERKFSLISNTIWGTILDKIQDSIQSTILFQQHLGQIWDKYSDNKLGQILVFG